MALFLSLLAVVLMIIHSSWLAFDTAGIAPTIGGRLDIWRWKQHAAQLILCVGHLIGDFFRSFLPPETMRSDFDMACAGPLLGLSQTRRQRHATIWIMTHLLPDQRTSLGVVWKTGENVLSFFRRYDEVPRNGQ